MKPIKLSQTTLNHGGMMRCCVASVVDYVQAHMDSEVGEGLTIPCKYEPPKPEWPDGRLRLRLEGERAVWRIDLD